MDEPATYAAAPRRSQRAPLNLPLDESVRFVGFSFLKRMPPTLYVDDYTLLSECCDISKLRAGDHCVVGVNLLHRLWTWSDAAVSLLTSWEVAPLRVYHHFVVVDNVSRIAADGRPLREDDGPVRVAEFSDSLPSACRRLVADGWSPTAMWRNILRVLSEPAKLHLPPLSDYMLLNGRGVFVVHEDRTDEQRQRTAQSALALADGPAAAQPTYRVLSSNCEHLAWNLDASSSAYGMRWVSPQVPHHLWNLFSVALRLVGLIWLRLLAVTPETGHDTTHALATTLFHLFSTVPVRATCTR